MKMKVKMVTLKSLYWTAKVHKFRLFIASLVLFFASYFCSNPSIGTFFIFAFSFFASIELNVLLLIGDSKEITSLIGTYSIYKKHFMGDKK